MSSEPSIAFKCSTHFLPIPKTVSSFCEASGVANLRIHLMKPMIPMARQNLIWHALQMPHDFIFDATLGEQRSEGILWSYAIGDKADDLAARGDEQLRKAIQRDLASLFPGK